MPVQVQRVAFWRVCAVVAATLTGGLSLLLTDLTRRKVAGAAVRRCGGADRRRFNRRTAV